MENKSTYKVLTIAGSDPSGGAGIQADIKAITALGGYAASAITALTIQNTLGVTGIFAVPPSVVSEQIAAVIEDIAPQSIKIGMVKDVDIVRHIAASIRKYHPACGEHFQVADRFLDRLRIHHPTQRFPKFRFVF